VATLFNKSLKTIACALRAGSITAREILETAIARHDAIGGQLNAYKTWNPDYARRQADAADAVLAIGRDLGPLQGIPTSIKDLYGVTGFPSFAGTRRRLPQKWEHEGPLVTALRNQLAIVTGKTHTAELGFGGLGVNPHWTAPRNPWDADAHRAPGGSSSGAGVSLWEGSALLALGTDTGGSGRIPASMTGTVGLKVGYGRWPMAGILPLSSLFDTPSLLGRSVADVAYAFAALDAASGDPNTLLAQLNTRTPTDCRIAVADSTLWQGCSAGVAETVQAALTESVRQGVKCSEPAMPIIRDALTFMMEPTVAAVECNALLTTELPEWLPLLGPIVAALVAEGETMTARDLLDRQRRFQAFAVAGAELFQDFDVMAMPTVPIAPPRLDELQTTEDYHRLSSATLRNTTIVSLLGLCALTLPAGLDPTGLPVGLQLVARHGEEERLLSVAFTLERILGSPRERLGVPPLCRSTGSAS
jgi:aspartyl-tRNA(Asn)/glutamyl-tRNA(Gln) amidotransferase subunit A